MYFKEISLYNFRNYKEAKITFHPRANLIIGMNAQGKTNLLESLSVMSLGKSFRTANDIEMIGFENEFCRAKAKYYKEEQEREIEITYSPAGKSIQIDGMKAEKTSELLDHVYTVIFSPEDLRIIKDEPEKRRRFMDRELCQLKPIYYKSLGKYKRILLQRNTLLKKEDPDEMMLDVWDKSLAECGGKILYERERFVEKLDFLSREMHKKITDGKEILDVSYETDISGGKTPAEKEELFLAKLKDGRRRDLFRGNTGVGPHKDDLSVFIDRTDARHFGSQGQQRTAALAMKLAEIELIKEEKGENPVLLLDDVLSELDEQRQKFLLNCFSDVQLFITAAELSESVFEDLPECRILEIRKGTAESRDIKKV